MDMEHIWNDESESNASVDSENSNAKETSMDETRNGTQKNSSLSIILLLFGMY